MIHRAGADLLIWMSRVASPATGLKYAAPAAAFIAAHLATFPVALSGAFPAPGAGQPADSVRAVVPAGTRLRLTLRDTVGTDRSRPGDGFRAAVDRPVTVGEDVVVPLGAVVRGRVAAVRSSGSAQEAAVVRLAIDSLVVDGRAYRLAARVVGSAPDRAPRTRTVVSLGIVGGAAAVGGVAGWLLGGGGGGAALGGALGAAAGAAAVTFFQEVDVVLPAGSELILRLEHDLVVDAG